MKSTSATVVTRLGLTGVDSATGVVNAAEPSGGRKSNDEYRYVCGTVLSTTDVEYIPHLERTDESGGRPGRVHTVEDN